MAAKGKVVRRIDPNWERGTIFSKITPQNINTKWKENLRWKIYNLGGDDRQEQIFQGKNA